MSTHPRSRPTLGTFLRRARAEMNVEQQELAHRIGISSRTLSRWESGAARPAAQVRANLVRALEPASADTWDAVVRAIGLDADATRAQSQVQTRLRAQAQTQTQTKAQAPAHAQAHFDAIVRAIAEDLDVTAGRLRGALGNLLADIARLGISPLDARAMILTRGTKSAGADVGREE